MIMILPRSPFKKQSKLILSRLLRCCLYYQLASARPKTLGLCLCRSIFSLRVAKNLAVLLPFRIVDGAKTRVSRISRIMRKREADGVSSSAASALSSRMPRARRLAHVKPVRRSLATSLTNSLAENKSSKAQNPGGWFPAPRNKPVFLLVFPKMLRNLPRQGSSPKIELHGVAAGWALAQASTW